MKHIISEIDLTFRKITDIIKPSKEKTFRRMIKDMGNGYSQ